MPTKEASILLIQILYSIQTLVPQDENIQVGTFTMFLNSDQNVQVCDATAVERVTIDGYISLRQAQGYFNRFNASPNLEIISLISSFLHVPTLSLYQAESRLAPNA